MKDLLQQEIVAHEDLKKNYEKVKKELESKNEKIMSVSFSLKISRKIKYFILDF